MQPDNEKVMQKLLQQNAMLTMANMQLETIVEQYKNEKDGKS